MESEEIIPRFVVDLSQPPEHRYDHIVPHLQTQVDSCDLSSIFDDLLRQFGGPVIAKGLGFVARIALRRVYRSEETAELAGISRAFGIPIHLLVAFNVLLDLLLGCTSGGVRAVDSEQQPASSRTPRMLHFRTLDWGMDTLRKLTVQLDFVHFAGGPVVATSVTYLGYVGVLTGVRNGLSMSLNFRPHHSRNSLRERLAFRCHQALVVLGFRQSISSVLRGFLLDTRAKNGKAATNIEMHTILSTLSSSPSTAAYLIFCTPERAYVVEKDHRKALIRDSDTYLTSYNHDVADEEDPAELESAVQELASTGNTTGMADVVSLSLDRKAHLDDLWAKRVRSCRRHHGQHGTVVTQKDVIRFLRDPEICNDETHYAVVMDPTLGRVIWARMYHIAEDLVDDIWNQGVDNSGSDIVSA